jgi:hypothetical protein
MKRKAPHRVVRWTDGSRPGELVSPYEDTPQPTREPRRTNVESRLGPYEAAYDISLGYGQERSIVLP